MSVGISNGDDFLVESACVGVRRKASMPFAIWPHLAGQSFQCFGPFIMAFSGVTRGGGGPPRVTPTRGNTRRKIFCG